MSEHWHMLTYNTSSETRRAFKEYVHTWKITDYISIHPGAEKYIESRGTVDDQDVWLLRLYPDGYICEVEPNYENDAALDVTFVKHFLNIKVDPYLFLIFLLDEHEREHEVFKLKNMTEDRVIVRRLVDKKDLYTKGFELLPNGDLIIRLKIYFNEIIDVIPSVCQLTNTRKFIINKECGGLQNPSFEERFKGDVRIVVHDKEFTARKSVLASRSIVLAAMLDNGPEGNGKNEIAITAHEPEVIEEMLRFITDGYVMNLGRVATSLLVAGQKFELEDLRDMCEVYLINNLNLQNVLTLMIFSQSFKVNALKEKAVEFFKLHLDEILKSEKYRASLERTLPLLPEIVKTLI